MKTSNLDKKVSRLFAVLLCGVFLLSGIPSTTAKAAATESYVTRYTSDGSYSVPSSGWYQIDAKGGLGGNFISADGTRQYGGSPGYVSGKYYFNAGTVLYIHIGRSGASGTIWGPVGGGVNGGGASGATGYAGGGGSSDVRVGGDTIYHRLIVAGGGGGASRYNNGMNGGAAGSGNNGVLYYGTNGSGNASGGGGGYYGGISGTQSRSSYGGSNYVGTGYSGVVLANTVSPSGYSSEVTITRISNNSVTVKLNGGSVNGSASDIADGFSGSSLYRLYNYAGCTQTFVADKDGMYQIECWGASGGGNHPSLSSARGFGGYAKGAVYLKAGTTLYVNVGGAGYEGSNASGGWNGGGSKNDEYSGGSSGGGATDVSLYWSGANTSWNNSYHLYSRIMVAGGGGGSDDTDMAGDKGSWNDGSGGHGGGVNGTAGAQDGSYTFGGGSQSGGAGFGYGGSSDNDDAGAGGGGWYGGYASSSVEGGGGGGSGYILTASSYKPSGYMVGSDYYVSDGYMQNGVNDGHGRVLIQGAGSVKQLPVPTREGYIFNGYSVVSGSGYITNNTVFHYAEGDTVVQANWTRIPNQYSLTINPAGGIYNNSESNTIVTKVKGTNYWVANPTRYGYVFTGWTLSGAGSLSGQTFIYGDGDAVLTANWQRAKSNLTIDANGGLYNESKDALVSSATFDGVSSKSYVNQEFGTKVLVRTPFKYGYTFDSWSELYGSDGYLNADDKSWHFGTTNGYLRVEWKENTYNIHYDKNTPSRASHAVTGTMINSANLAWSGTYHLNSNNFGLVGWTFQGWSLTPGDNNVVNYYNNQAVCNKTDAKLVDNPNDVTITLYAVWKENTYDIVFDGNNDTGYVAGSTAAMHNILYEDTVNLSKNGFTRTSPVNMEYKNGSWQAVPSVFQGWNYSTSDGQSVTFIDECPVTKLSATDRSTVVLYAVWDDNPTFNIGPYHDPENGNPNQNFTVEFPDRYFTLSEAQNGIITEAEMLRHVTAYDREGSISISLVGFDPEEYKSLTAPGNFTQTYKVTDSIGRYSYMTVNVYITENASVTEEVDSIMRSYDGFYYIYEDGSLVDISNGGLYGKSKWISDDAAKAILQQILLSRGNVNNVVYSFSADDMKNIKDYVKQNGAGNTDRGNLAEAYLRYIKANQKQ